MSKKTDREQLLELLAAKDNNYKYRKYYTLFFQDKMLDPITGLDISRDKYPNIVKFFDAGREFKERAIIAPNRCGKTQAGCFEMTAHLTKDYPEWWTGYRCKNKQCNFLFVGKTNLAARNVAQRELLGSVRTPGTGMLPHKEYNKGVGVNEKSFTRKTGVAEAVLDLYVTDIYGNDNQIFFASMDQFPEVIEGMTLDGIWFDENKTDPKKWYNEAFARTITTDGFLFSTFTPWPDGMTQSVLNFIPARKIPEDNVTVTTGISGYESKKWVIGLDLNLCPHMTPEQKQVQMGKYVGSEYDARVLGLPALGAGAVFQTPVDDIIVPSFKIPQTWDRAYGLDFGWGETAAVWITMDPNTEIRYLYAEYHKGHASSFVHVESIQARGRWIPGVADPSGNNSSGPDGKQYIAEYGKLGLDLIPGKNRIEASIVSLQIQFEAGRLKVFDTCRHFIEEYSMWRYDDNGKIARNQDDHEIDALRYVDSMFEAVAVSELEHQKEEAGFYDLPQVSKSSRDAWSGY